MKHIISRIHPVFMFLAGFFLVVTTLSVVVRIGPISYKGPLPNTGQFLIIFVLCIVFFIGAFLMLGGAGTQKQRVERAEPKQSPAHARHY